MKMNNRWNRIIYRLWAPVYDSTVNRLFLRGRRRALELLDLKAGERVLISGVGTGADLPFLPAGVHAIGVDLSPEMLAKARLKLDQCAASVTLMVGDAQKLPIQAASCNAAILNLILSVVPDGSACLGAAVDALQPGGRAVIFDKFVQDDRRVSSHRKLLNLFSTLFGTDINRRLSDLMKDCQCKVIHDEPGILGGAYRVILLQKTEAAQDGVGTYSPAAVTGLE